MSLPISPIERVETPTGHWYRNKETGQQVPGVTTILKVLPAQKLDDWKIRKAVELTLKGETGWKKKPPNENLITWLMSAGEREANVKAKIGTAAHNFAEDHVLGNKPDKEALNKKEQYHVDCFLNFVRDHEPKPVLVEKVVTHIDEKTGIPLYCGTIDLVADLKDGYRWLVDYKASAGSAKAQYALQGAAYKYATHWIDDDGLLQPMPSTERSAVVLLNGGDPDKGYRMYRMDDSPVVFSVFKNLLRIYNFSKIEDRVILGQI